MSRTPLASRLGDSAVPTLAIFLLLVGVAPALLNDPDTQWHIATGRLIWAGGAFPVTDPFSSTFAGRPWVAKEWLAQMLLFAGDAAAGWRGVVVVTAAAAALAFGLVYDALAVRLRWTVALAAMLGGVVLATPALVARPHVLVLPLVALWVRALVSALERGRAPALPFALVLAAWANMHASFPLGLVVAALVAADAVATAPPGGRVDAARRWAVFLAMSALGTGLTPYGFRTVAIVLQLFTTPEATRSITEWQPLRADVFGLACLFGFCAAATALVRAGRGAAFRLLAVLLVAALTLAHARFALFFAVIAPLLAAGPAAQAFPGLRSTATPPTRRRTPHVMALALAAVALPAAVDPQPRAAIRPIAALAAAQAAGLRGPVYNDFDFGGFLIANGVRTFVDGRTDQLFLDRFLTGLVAAVDAPAPAPFAALLDAHGITWALVRTGSAEARHLSALPGWARLFDDGVAAVYARRA